jgi:hypothetical protein
MYRNARECRIFVFDGKKAGHRVPKQRQCELFGKRKNDTLWNLFTTQIRNLKGKHSFGKTRQNTLAGDPVWGLSGDLPQTGS